MAYMSQQPRIVHKPYLWGCGNLIGKHMNDLCASLSASCHAALSHHLASGLLAACMSACPVQHAAQ